MSELGHKSGSVIKLHEIINCENMDDDKLILIIDFAEFGEIMRWNEETLKWTSCLENGKPFNT